VLETLIENENHLKDLLNLDDFREAFAAYKDFHELDVEFNMRTLRQALFSGYESQDPLKSPRAGDTSASPMRTTAKFVYDGMLARLKKQTKGD